MAWHGMRYQNRCLLYTLFTVIMFENNIQNLMFQLCYHQKKWTHTMLCVVKCSDLSEKNSKYVGHIWSYGRACSARKQNSVFVESEFQISIQMCHEINHMSSILWIQIESADAGRSIDRSCQTEKKIEHAKIGCSNMMSRQQTSKLALTSIVAN